jgi:hypothetical protein
MLKIDVRKAEQVFIDVPASAHDRTVTLIVPPTVGRVRFVLTLAVAPVQRLRLGFEAVREVAINRGSVQVSKDSTRVVRSAYEGVIRRGA